MGVPLQHAKGITAAWFSPDGFERQFVRVAAGLDCRLGHGLRLGPTKQSFHPVAESGSGSSVSEFNGIRQRLDLDNPNTADKCLSRQNA